MTDKMKNTIVGGILGGIFLVLSTTLPVYLTSRKELKEMQEKYEATIAAMQQQMQATQMEQTAEWRSLVKIDKECRGSYVMWPANQAFSVKGVPRSKTDAGFVMTNIWLGPLIEFSFHGGKFSKLSFSVGVDEYFPGIGIKTTVLYISFDKGEPTPLELTNDMGPSTHSVDIPEGAQTVRLEIAKDGDLAGKTANYVFYDVLVR